MSTRAVTGLGVVILAMAVAPMAPAIAAEKPVNLTLAAGGSAGAWYVGGAVISEITRGMFPHINVTPVPGGGVANMRAIEKGDADIAFAFWTMAAEAVRGDEPFKIPHTKIQAVMSLLPSYVQIVARKDGNVKTIQDLVGKRINAGLRGFGGTVTFLRILEVHGITIKDIEAKGGKVHFLNYTDAMEMLQDGLLDVLAAVGTIPAYFRPLEALFPLQLIPIAEDKVRVFQEKFPGWVLAEIPRGAYRGVDAPVPTVASWVGLVARDSLPLELVYKITKAIFEKRQRLVDAYPAYKDIILKENVLQGITVPFHPGAQQYYREIGLLK